MGCKGFWIRIFSFALTLTVGLGAVKVFWPETAPGKLEVERPVPVNIEKGRGCGECPQVFPPKNDFDKSLKPAAADLTGLKIISKPRALYTDEARQNNVQGKVVLRVAFLANGEIGGIKTISSLPDGLTETAIEAVRGIKFEPARNGVKKISVTKTVEYSFTIY